MELQLIRNATMRIKYAGHLILADPFLAEKLTLRSFANISKNPTVDLPCTPEEAIAGAEMAIISHLHPDHFDEVAQNQLAKDLLLFCQPTDQETIQEMDFTNVTPVDDTVTWQGISITRTPGQHGTGELLKRLGLVAGFILRAEGESTVYWMGDTIWYDAVEQVVAEHQPDIIITHSSGAKIGDSDPIVMDAPQTIAVCEAAPEATVIAIHLESLDHGTVSRADLRAYAIKHNISEDRLLIPADGETLSF